MPIYNNSPFPPSAQKTSHLFPVSMKLSILDISCKWNHILCGLLCLFFFLTWHNIFEVHLRCSICEQIVVLFLLNSILLCIYVTSVYPLPDDEHLGYFRCVGIKNNADMNIHMQVLNVDTRFHFSCVDTQQCWAIWQLYV